MDHDTVINVGLMAFGLSGRVFHAPFILTNPRFNLLVVYERTKRESEQFAEKYGSVVEIVCSESELVNFPHIQLVVVCSPIEFHFAHAKMALEAGKHVLVEKAFCSTSAQAKVLLELAAEKGLVCVPFQNRRYDSDFLTLKRLLPQLGRIAEYNGYFNRYSPTVRKNNWKDTVAGSGGNFLSLGSHMIDQAVALFGAPQRVWADVRAQRVGGVLDDAWEVHLFYPSNSEKGASEASDSVDSTGVHHGGFRAILKGSLLCRDHSVRYMVHGERGSWRKEGLDTQEAYLMAGGLPYYPNEGGSAVAGEGEEAVYGSEPRSQWGVLTSAVADSPNSSTRELTEPVLGSYHMLYDELYNSIVHGAPPAVDAHTAVAVLRIIELSLQSSKEGRVLPYTPA